MKSWLRVQKQRLLAFWLAKSSARAVLFKTGLEKITFYAAMGITQSRVQGHKTLAFIRAINPFRCLVIVSKWLFLITTALIIMGGIFLQFMFSQQPLIKAPYSLTASERSRAKAIFKQVKSSHQAIELLILDNRDLNSSINYLCNKYLLSGIQITLAGQRLDFTVTLLLPENSLWRYVNVKFQLSPPYHLADISHLQIGYLLIPDKITQILIQRLNHYRPFIHYYSLIKRHILALRIENRRLLISYVPHPLSPLTQERQAIDFYAKKIVQIVAAQDPAQPLSLISLFNPLFKIAYQRSTLKTAIKENKVVMMAVNEYVNRKEIQRYLPFQITSAKQPYRPVMLYGRADLPKHFITSAVLAMTASSSFALAMGVEKELRDRDAKHGSGFSFIDLASDRAGIKFSQVAIASLQRARQLQLTMAATQNDSAFIPKLDDFPENMGTKSFSLRFGSVYSAEYETVVAEIDRRIAALPIYKMR
jgi:hypothetical protein